MKHANMQINREEKEDIMHLIRKIFQRKYFEADEELGFWEEIIFEHELDLKKNLVRRCGVKLEWLGILILISINLLVRTIF